MVTRNLLNRLSRLKKIKDKTVKNTEHHHSKTTLKKNEICIIVEKISHQHFPYT